MPEIIKQVRGTVVQTFDSETRKCLSSQFVLDDDPETIIRDENGNLLEQSHWVNLFYPYDMALMVNPEETNAPQKS